MTTKTTIIIAWPDVPGIKGYERRSDPVRVGALVKRWLACRQPTCVGVLPDIIYPAGLLVWTCCGHCGNQHQGRVFTVCTGVG